MFSTSVTAAAVILTFLPVFAFDVLEKQDRIATLQMLAGIGSVAALCCIAAGIAQLAGWAEPMTAAARAAPYWPIGLIAVGGFWTIVYGTTQWRLLRVSVKLETESEPRPHGKFRAAKRKWLGAGAGRLVASFVARLGRTAAPCGSAPGPARRCRLGPLRRQGTHEIGRQSGASKVPSPQPHAGNA